MNSDVTFSLIPNLTSHVILKIALNSITKMYLHDICPEVFDPALPPSRGVGVAEIAQRSQIIARSLIVPLGGRVQRRTNCSLNRDKSFQLISADVSGVSVMSSRFCPGNQLSTSPRALRCSIKLTYAPGHLLSKSLTAVS